VTADRRRILVVDDEPDVRIVVGLNMGLAGMEFGEASDGAEALEMLTMDGPWDACIVDLMMPRSDGFELLAALADRGSLDQMAVVVLSAQGSPAAAIRALELGAHAHLTKPFSPNAVAHVVEELMELTPEERDARRLDAIERAGTLARLGVSSV